MEVTLNWMAIFVSAFMLMFLGFGWYHERVFGRAWMALAQLNEKDIKEAMPKPLIISAIWSFLVPFALYHIIYVTDAFYSDASWWINSIGVGLWVGIVFGFLTTLMHDSFELRPTKLAFINAGFYFTAIVLTSVVIGVIA